MGLKTILESLDGVPESQQTLYLEKDGKFILDIDGVDDHPAVVALRNGHNNSKRERDEAKEKLREAEAKIAAMPENFDPDEWARLKAEDDARQRDPDNKDGRRDLEAAREAIKSQYEVRLANERKRLEADIARLKEQNAKHETWRRQTLVDQALTAALTDVGVMKPALLKAAKALLRTGVEVVEDGDEFVPRMTSDLGGDDVAKYIQNWAQGDDGKAFVEQPRGGDAKGSGFSRGGDGSNNPFAKAAWSKTEQGRLYKADGAKADRLAKAAGFPDLQAALRAALPAV